MEDVTGRAFGRLTAVRFSHFAPGRFPHWLCACECGSEKTVNGYSLLSGRTQSCGCLQRERSTQARLSHGMSKHRAYRCWARMKNRCENPNAIDFDHYGARGILLCQEWRTFEGFWTDMGASWARGLTIERDDVDGNYSPSNCRWIPITEQTPNRRDNIMIETPWGAMSAPRAAKRVGVPYRAFIQRVKAGWPMESLFRPVPASRPTIYGPEPETASSSAVGQPRQLTTGRVAASCPGLGCAALAS
jgi:hypothetical protein